MKLPKIASVPLIALLASLVIAPVTVANPVFESKSKAELKIKAVDLQGIPVKLKKPAKGKVEFKKKAGPSKDKVKKTLKLSVEKSKKLPALKLKGKAKFDKKKIALGKPFKKKKKFEVFDEKKDKKIADFELPVDLSLDVNRSGLISGFSFDLQKGASADILDTQLVGLSAASIAEPETALLLGLGMFGLAWFGVGRTRLASTPA